MNEKNVYKAADRMNEKHSNYQSQLHTETHYYCRVRNWYKYETRGRLMNVYGRVKDANLNK